MREDSKDSMDPNKRLKRGNSTNLKSGLTRSRSSNITMSSTVASRLKLWVSSSWFERMVLTMIVTNAAWIGVDVDWNNTNGDSSYRSPVPNGVFLAVENIFCFFFVFEIIVRFLSYEPKLQFFLSPRSRKSNLFDSFLVFVMILEVWILAPIGETAHLHHMTLVRLLRLMRLLRISRIFRMVPELGMMVRTLAKAVRTVSSTLVMEIGIMYVFAVIFTQWVKGHSNPCFYELEDQCILSEYFGSIPKSLVTFMQILVFDDTFAIIRPILADSWYMGCLLLFFMVLGGWTVLNMLIGIICEIITTSTVEEKRRILEQRVREVFAMIDQDGSGTVSREEFELPSVQQHLVKLGISKVVWQNAFDILDEDGSGDFDVDEFLTMVFKLLHPPQSQDIQELNTRICQIQAAMNINSRNPATSKSLKRAKSMKTAATANIFTTRSASKEATGQQDEGGKLRRSMTLPSRFEEKNDAENGNSGPTENNDGPPAEQAPRHPHPFAPECEPPSLSSKPHPLMKGALPSKSAWEAQSDTSPVLGFSQPPASPLPKCQQNATNDTAWSLDSTEKTRQKSKESAESQAQFVHDKLRQLGQSTEKVDEALRLVHGTPLWQKSDEKVNHDPENDLPKHNLSANSKLDDSAVVEEAEALLAPDPSTQSILIDGSRRPSIEAVGNRGEAEKGETPMQSDACQGM